MFLFDQFDSAVTDSLAREYEARRVTMILGKVGDTEKARLV